MIEFLRALRNVVKVFSIFPNIQKCPFSDTKVSLEALIIKVVPHHIPPSLQSWIGLAICSKLKAKRTS